MRGRAASTGLEEVFVSRNGRPLRRIPGDKPVFSHFEVDRQGRIWVQVYTRGVLEPETPGEEDRRREACAFFGATEAECDEGITEWRQPLVFDVLEPDGRYLGRLELPNRRADVYHARDDLLWVVETGELGEQYVVRYRIEPGG